MAKRRFQKKSYLGSTIGHECLQSSLVLLIVEKDTERMAIIIAADRADVPICWHTSLWKKQQYHHH